MTPPRMRRDLLRQADLLVALTDHEASVLRTLAPDTRVQVVGNGVQEVGSVQPDLAQLGISRPYVVLLGTVSRRKQQVETLRALEGSQWQPVVIGGLDGGPDDAADFRDALAVSRGVWLGDVSDQRLVRGLLTSADALLHFSRAEGQSLAILEALSVHTPVVCSDLPANRELAARYPGWLTISPSSSVPDTVVARAVGDRPAQPPEVDTWTHVAERLVEEYRRLVPATK
jgi:glycosyltransferase involved in cell wall biosynthesis